MFFQCLPRLFGGNGIAQQISLGLAAVQCPQIVHLPLVLDPFSHDLQIQLAAMAMIAVTMELRSWDDRISLMKE